MMENEEKRNVKCKRCGTYRYPSQFFSKGRQFKTCQICRDNGKIYREKNKCIHGIRRNNCNQCDGIYICEHGRQKYRCKQCGGSSICEHNRQKDTCKNCMNHEQKIEYIQKTMISHSRQTDKKSNRYDPDNFIDKCFLEGLFEDSENCHYCGVQFTYNERCNTLVTIERLNNSLGHIKSNCVLACLNCNCRHKSRDDSDDSDDEKS